MNAGRGDTDIAVGGPARHLPVLRAEILTVLAPHAGGTYLDATFGAGGYTRAILATEGAKVLALDRDPTAVAGAEPSTREFPGRLSVARARFSDLERIAKDRGFASFDGVVFDIGVSSMQLDEPARGFSFRQDGPLDMRMEGEGQSAADLVNRAEEAELADILYYFGEERAARRIARAIIAERGRAPILTTARLAEIVGQIVPGRPGAIHPATRTFQALRIAVNDELGELAEGLVAAEHVLKEGGRLAVVTFHSLEDRIVKQFFAARSGRGEALSRLLPGEHERPAPTFIISGRQPVTPTPQEIAQNPRARSAKLRFATRTSAPARGPDAALLELSGLPQRGRGG
ncbi:MAG TPA: 16S rRNA (cytosine(1402)-N(4))-methyltransferase RsmH [Methylovirgula sp.]|nr:16S rRNA (cytosine(1402)-N(4))-methyltransferase RsmH [Methylovirgula sp.]